MELQYQLKILRINKVLQPVRIGVYVDCAEDRTLCNLKMVEKSIGITANKKKL